MRTLRSPDRRVPIAVNTSTAMATSSPQLGLVGEVEVVVGVGVGAQLPVVLAQRLAALRRGTHDPYAGVDRAEPADHALDRSAAA